MSLLLKQYNKLTKEFKSEAVALEEMIYEQQGALIESDIDSLIKKTLDAFESVQFDAQEMHVILEHMTYLAYNGDQDSFLKDPDFSFLEYIATLNQMGAAYSNNTTIVSDNLGSLLDESFANAKELPVDAYALSRMSLLHQFHSTAMSDEEFDETSKRLDFWESQERGMLEQRPMPVMGNIKKASKGSESLKPHNKNDKPKF